MFAENQLSPLGNCMSPPSVQSEIVSRFPTSKDWGLNCLNSPFANNYGNEFSFGEAQSPAKLRHKQNKNKIGDFEGGSPSISQSLLSPTSMLSPNSMLMGMDYDSNSNDILLTNSIAMNRHVNRFNSQAPVPGILSSPTKQRLGIAESKKNNQMQFNVNEYNNSPLNALSEAAKASLPKQKITKIKNDVTKSNNKSNIYNDNNEDGYPKSPTKLDNVWKLDQSKNKYNYSNSDNTSPQEFFEEDGEPVTKSINCNCKKSRCLKLYCDCFRVTKYCDGCNCNDCDNLYKREPIRQNAIQSIMDRNPEAFKPRVSEEAKLNSGSSQNPTISKSHLSGCHCKKSACLKKYCECYTGQAPCSDRCRCQDCKNIPSLYNDNGVAIGSQILSGPKKSINYVSIKYTGNSQEFANADLHSFEKKNYINSAKKNVARELSDENILLNLASLCEQREATDSLLALSPTLIRQTNAYKESSMSPLNLLNRN